MASSSALFGPSFAIVRPPPRAGSVARRPRGRVAAAGAPRIYNRRRPGGNRAGRRASCQEVSRAPGGRGARTGQSRSGPALPGRDERGGHGGPVRGPPSPKEARDGTARATGDHGPRSDRARRSSRSTRSRPMSAAAGRGRRPATSGRPRGFPPTTTATPTPACARSAPPWRTGRSSGSSSSRRAWPRATTARTRSTTSSSSPARSTWSWTTRSST